MGIVFDIQKCSVHDGPGVRTTVFLKGCNIRCKWCHNPESFRVLPNLAYEAKNCIGCGECVLVCHKKTHSLDSGKHEIDFHKCTGCGECLRVCPAKCLKLYGKEMTAEEVIYEVQKDRRYYEGSGGGVTFSGGEPSVQYEFLLSLLLEARKAKLHICLETNGIVSADRWKVLAEYTDLFLLDYKATGEALHKELTGQGNWQMLFNLQYLYQVNKSVILRCPIVPGLNDTKEHFEAIRELKKKYPNIIRAEIMAYHSLGKGKWESIGMEYTLKDLPDAGEKAKFKWEEQIGSICGIP